MQNKSKKEMLPQANQTLSDKKTIDKASIVETYLNRIKILMGKI